MNTSMPHTVESSGHRAPPTGPGIPPGRNTTKAASMVRLLSAGLMNQRSEPLLQESL